MASSSNSVSKSLGKGASEEPEPGPDDASSSTAAASYDPADYQKPHPDDRGGAGGKKVGATKPRGKAKVAPTDKAKDKGKGKKGKATGRCGNCDAEGAVLRCAQCGTEVYCDVNCQRVSGGRVSRVSTRGA